MIVIDCSSLVHFLLGRSPVATKIRERIAQEDILAAPGLIDYEITSAVFGLARGRNPKITAREAVKAIGDFNSLAIDRHATLVLWERVRKLSDNLSTYDAHYVALAETLGAPLITSDDKIRKAGAARCEIEVFASGS
ncbi:type II toxin-antitoxin system VapC family toxin [Streptomyces gobiensis]|uniref:type II toxin-antitoxin system VapC family toxin n=1 Tax=Streptomyces gobiensis TaxID=2875706 RepID=UPI001E615693|nr:type II toxin-antitoxin system VapC family toxin [Streptomyces gobiensis]UGY93062.1 type II toxin-antitoxin system VapC family toxin [Streptomyces gobiensis]